MAVIARADRDRVDWRAALRRRRSTNDPYIHVRNHARKTARRHESQRTLVQNRTLPHTRTANEHAQGDVIASALAEHSVEQKATCTNRLTLGEREPFRGCDAGGKQYHLGGLSEHIFLAKSWERIGSEAGWLRDPGSAHYDRMRLRSERRVHCMSAAK